MIIHSFDPIPCLFIPVQGDSDDEVALMRIFYAAPTKSLINSHFTGFAYAIFYRIREYHIMWVCMWIVNPLTRGPASFTVASQPTNHPSIGLKIEHHVESPPPQSYYLRTRSFALLLLIIIISCCGVHPLTLCPVNIFTPLYPSNQFMTVHKLYVHPR